MKRLLIGFALFLLFPSCLIPPEPEPEPEILCEALDMECRGSDIQACVALDGSWCAYEANERYFECYSCNPLICESAAEEVIEFCYGF